MSRSWAELLGEADALPDPDGERRGLFSRLRESLGKSRRALAEQLAAVAFDPGDDAAWERLETWSQLVAEALGLRVGHPAG